MLNELLRKIDGLVIEVSEEDDYVLGYNDALTDVKDTIKNLRGELNED